MKIVYAIAFAVLVATCMPASAFVVVNQSVNETEVLSAQQGWCDALVAISSTYAKSGHSEAKALAEQVIDQAYGYQMGVVLFKPTLTINPQTFRPTRSGALSYFVGGDPAFPNDSGFALKGWTNCKPDNAAIFITGNSAITMGKVHLTDKNGMVTTVDKTWGYVKDDAGTLRIVLHHSSLEFSVE
ncbi:hypothetical protein [Desulfonatronum parangueonense]